MFKKIILQILQIKLLLVSMVRHPIEFVIFFKSIRGEEILSQKRHILMASDWLLNAQKNGLDDGFSRGFYLYKKGWDVSYLETTGYIIPTLLNVYQYTKDKKYKQSALDAGLWLLDMQKESGAFTDVDKNIELAFDTGQILYGLIAIYELDCISEELKYRYMQAIYDASQWLCNVQDADGSWEKFGVNKISHSYYSRVACVLYKSGSLLDNKQFKDSAKQNIDWVLSCQNQLGFFNKSEFKEGQDSLLHTIVYVLEGLYGYYVLTKDKNVLESLLLNANKFKEININRDLLLCSQYDKDFSCVNNERCITGLAQWSNISFKLYDLTKDSDYLLIARKTLYYLKSMQFKQGDNLQGALPGSTPFWGVYAPYSAINWGVKFFIDALLENEKLKLSLIEESSLWVNECFKFNSGVVNDKFTQTGYAYLKVLNKYVAHANNVLDLGCGKGKYLQYFEDKFKSKNIKGIDPSFYDGNKIKKGDVYKINFAEKFELIYTIEVLQHVKYLDEALEEIYNKLTDNGYFIICDRNPNSFIGYIKFIQEYRGKWMYPFDSPFLEKWYSIKQWKKMLGKSGFVVEHIKTFSSKTSFFSRANKYNIIITKKKR